LRENWKQNKKTPVIK